MINIIFKSCLVFQEFSGGPVVRTWHFHCQRLGSIPGQGTKSHTSYGAAKKKKKTMSSILS